MAMYNTITWKREGTGFIKVKYPSPFSAPAKKLFHRYFPKKATITSIMTNTIILMK